jgi:hypothetical protein
VYTIKEKYCARCIFGGQHIHFWCSIFVTVEKVLSLGLKFLYKYELDMFPAEVTVFMSV